MLLCSLLGFSRQAFYKRMASASRQANHEETIVKAVKTYRKVLPKTGTVKLIEALQDQWIKDGIKIGRDKLNDLLDRHHMLLRRRKRRKPRTTMSIHGYPTYPDLLKGAMVSHTHQVYAADMTYIHLSDGQPCYLFLVTELFSRAIVGYKFSNRATLNMALSALRMAIKIKPKEIDTIHHSDRDIRYCCPKYRNLLRQYGFQISTTQSSDPRDNAIAERVNGIIKHELIYPFGSITNLQEGQRRIKEAINKYNRIRLHRSNHLRKPVELLEEIKV